MEQSNMTNDDPIKLFCTEYLLQSDCSYGRKCIFTHANMRDITLCDELTDEEVFVKGSYNHGWQKRSRNKRGKPRNKSIPKRPNVNSDNNTGNRYSTRNNRRTQKQNEANAPSTSNQYVTSNRPSSSTGACKKVLTNEKKCTPHTLTSYTSESENENSKNLPNIPFQNHKDWINSREFVPSNTESSIATSEKTKNEDNTTEAAAKYVSPKQERKDSEVAGAVPDPQKKECGICFEVIMEKSHFERRFGILPNCNHCFCLTCIRKWRQAKQFENNIIRACPECRVTSDFVCPSTYWVETESAKEKLINNYKQVLSKKDCKYFKQGNGSCPFGNKCFYLHALKNGVKVDVGPPSSQRLENEFFDEMDLLHKLVLLEYFQNDLLDYSDSDDDDDDEDDDDEDEDFLEYMYWDSDEDLLI